MKRPGRPLEARWSGKRRIASNEEFLRWAVEQRGNICMKVIFAVRDPIDKWDYHLRNTRAKVIFRTPGAALTAVTKIHELLDFLAREGRYPEFN